MMCSARELVTSMIDSVMLRVADIDQPIIAAPAVRVDGNVRRDATTNYRLKCALLAVGDDLRVHAPITLEDAEDDGLARRPAPAFAAHAASAEVTLVNLNFARGEGRGALTFFSDTAPHLEKDRGHRLPAQAGQFSRRRGGEIEREVTYELTEFALAYSGTSVVAV